VVKVTDNQVHKFTPNVNLSGLSAPTGP